MVRCNAYASAPITPTNVLRNAAINPLLSWNNVSAINAAPSKLVGDFKDFTGRPYGIGTIAPCVYLEAPGKIASGFGNAYSRRC